jgi:hypothetical protein
MSAFAGVIHIQSSASVAPMQALAGDSWQIVAAAAPVPSTAFGKKASGARRVVRQDTLGSFTGFNRMATCGMIMVLKPLMRAKRRCDGYIR